MNTPATVLVLVLLVAGMVAMGTSTTVAELRAVARRPGPLLIAASVNLVLIPAAAFPLLRALPLDGTTALALMVIAAAPGGGTGALLSWHVRADVSHAVALQVVLAGTSLVAAPLWLQLYTGDGDAAASVRILPLVAALFAFQVLPLLAGLVLGSRRPRAAARVHPYARRTADLSLAALILVLVVTSGHRLDENGGAAVAGIAVVLGLTLLLGLLAPGGPRVRRATVMTSLVRNLSLALAAAAFADDPDASAMLVLSYGLAMYLVAVGWVGVVRSRGRRTRRALTDR